MTLRNLPTEIEGKAPRTGLRLPGTSGNYVSCPDAAALSVTGDLDLRWLGSLNDWTPTGNRQLIDKYTGAGQSSWLFQINATSGTPRLYWSADGTALLTSAATAAPTVSDGAVLGLRVALDVDAGASNKTVTFFTRTDDDISSNTGWTQLGSVVTTAGTTSVFDSTAPIEVGSAAGGTAELLAGTVQRVEVRDGIDGTVVASYDATAPMGPRYRDPEANIWTINGSAWAWEKS